MIDHGEKSTEVPPVADARAEVETGLILDGRLGLYHPAARWLAVSDLHFGYEASRRRAGGLWPMWGMETVEERLRSLILSYQPETLILVGDVIDSSAVPDEAIAWLCRVKDLCGDLVLIEGNHDRGPVRKRFDWVPWFRTDGFFFQHGHEDWLSREVTAGESLIEIRGHLHPSVRFNDGAGTTLTLPAFTLAEEPGSTIRNGVLPAFSPWAGGSPIQSGAGGRRIRQWACSRQRVFEIPA